MDPFEKGHYQNKEEENLPAKGKMAASKVSFSVLVACVMCQVEPKTPTDWLHCIKTKCAVAPMWTDLASCQPALLDSIFLIQIRQNAAA